MKRKKAKKTQPRKRRSTGVVRERDPIPWKYCLLTIVCGLFLVAGFFGAARQHFASIDYGIKNSKLRKEIKDLKAQQRRLRLSKEVSLSPFEIKKAAKKYGFVERSNTPAPVMSAVKPNDRKDEEIARDEKNDKKKDSSGEPKVKKIVQTKKKQAEKKETAKKNNSKKRDEKTKRKKEVEKKRNKRAGQKSKKFSRNRKVNTRD